uniref:Gfo/Idh/MocA-like oxidoreductase N-terminal domain-containing protein n=1 Tax=Laticauda laticaudata TaxID=8630 RepID=A0A8C5RSR1_LATLA
MLPGVGVFGTSLTARVIIPLLKDEGFAVKALWGRTQEEAEELAKEMSVPFYTSRIDEVLLHQDVDLVCINLPPPLTRQIAVKTLGESPRGAWRADGWTSEVTVVGRPWKKQQRLETEKACLEAKSLAAP